MFNNEEQLDQLLKIADFLLRYFLFCVYLHNTKIDLQFQ